MNINAHRLPRSARGRAAARFLQKRGYIATVREAIGNHVCNVAADLTAQDARHLAFILAPELANDEEQYAFERADLVRRDASLSSLESEALAARIEGDWARGA